MRPSARSLLGPMILAWGTAALFDLVVLWYSGLPVFSANSWRGLILVGALLVLGDRAAVELEDGSPLTPAPALLVAGLTVAGWALLPLAALCATLLSAAFDRHHPRQALLDSGVRCMVSALITPIYLLTQPANMPPYSTPLGIAGLLLIGAVAFMVELMFGPDDQAPRVSRPRWRARLAAVRWYVLAMIPLGGLLGALWTFSSWAFLLGLVPLAVAQRSFASEVRLRRATADVTRLAVQRENLALRLERLLALATVMKGTIEVQEMLEILCRRLAALLEASAGWVALLDEAGQPQLMTHHNVPFAGGTPPRIVDPAGYASLLERGQVMLVTDERRQGLAPAVPGDIPRWAEVLSIPLIGEKSGGGPERPLLGAICLAFDRVRGLGTDEQRVLTSFAHQAAVSIENARLFDELRRKQDELIQSSKLAAVGTFAAGIAHEFNNLLGSMLGYAELGYYADDPAEKNSSLQVVIQACRRGRSITRGLLTFARRQTSHRALADVTDAVDEVLTLVEIDLRKARITVERQVEPVPPTLCDLGQIAQVVLNLITNARDAMMPGGGTLTVGLRERQEQIEISVADTGCGIAPAIRDKIFEPFITTKGAPNGGQTSGTGLGLSVSYGIVRDHGGTIIVESALGRGTTMIVRLPVTAVAEETEVAVGR